MNLMNIEDQEDAPQLDSVGAKIWHIIDKYYPMGGFTSNEILEKYEDEHNEPIKLSVVSTYLARFSTKGRINRLRNGREWVYKYERKDQNRLRSG
jgi:predicted transcriptional regulator